MGRKVGIMQAQAQALLLIPTTQRNLGAKRGRTITLFTQPPSSTMPRPIICPLRLRLSQVTVTVFLATIEAN